jgi:phage terminase large subunit-like protein
LRSYLPEAALTDGRNASYLGWNEEGWMKTTDGDVLDFERIKMDILEDRDEVGSQFQELGYDPWQARQLSTELIAEMVNMVEVKANVGNFSEPMKEWEALIKSGRFHHNGDPVYRWSVSNVVCHYDLKDNIYPRKERPENKIDPAVATIIAMNRLMLSEQDAYSATRGIRTL